MLNAYCKEVLLFHNSFPEPDLNQIAKSGSKHDLLILSSFVLTVAVNCENKNKYIQRIMTLPEDLQAALMVAIEQTMYQLEAPSPNPDQPDPTSFSNNSPNLDPSKQSALFSKLNINPNSSKEHINSILQTELLAQFEKNDSIQANLEKLSKDVDRWHQKYEGEKQTKLELSNQLELALSSNNNPPSYDPTSKTFTIVKAENDALRSDLEKAELQNNNLTSQLQEMILKLNKANSENLSQKSQLAELEKLRDQEQEYLFLQEKLSKSENIIEKYRVKLEQSTDLKKKLASVEQQLKNETETRAIFESKYLSLLSSKSDSQNSLTISDSLTKLESQLNLATIENSELVNKLSKLESENKKLSSEAQLYKNSSRDLEERIRELELGAANLASQYPNANANTLSSSQNNLELAETLGESPAQLKQQIKKLSLEIKKLRRGSVIKDDHIKEKALFESWVEIANAEKLDALSKLSAAENTISQLSSKIQSLEINPNNDTSKLEQSLKEKQSKIEELQTGFQNVISENKSLLSKLDNYAVEITNYKAQLNATIAELKEQSAVLAQLEKICTSSKYYSAGNNSEKPNLVSWYTDLELLYRSKSEQLENLQSEQSELEGTIQTQRGRMAELENLVIGAEQNNLDVKSITEKLLESRKECHNYVLSLQKSKQLIKKLSKDLESSSSSNVGSEKTLNVQISRMQSDLDSKQEEIAGLKEQIKSIQKQKNFETRLMSSAWFYMQRKMEQDNDQIGTTGARAGSNFSNVSSGSEYSKGINPNYSSTKNQPGIKGFDKHSASASRFVANGRFVNSTSSWLESQREAYILILVLDLCAGSLSSNCEYSFLTFSL
ncbi:hypothetical protein BB560_002256 [Smittium megazygosporum]|uniref:HOOK N-terminal domain-containing protein n=1 Tax=Smittium megazygosporum TaxID=133381 RepID=A0A2T9ZFH7_9FUNG|nr:hypothetical protein BB560_002256 [Smittium megazygosporum]